MTTQNICFTINDDCIACDTCTDIAPKHFKLTDDYQMAVVFCQPTEATQTSLCNEALEACPVAAIETK